MKSTRTGSETPTKSRRTRWLKIATKLAREPTETLRGSEARILLYGFRELLGVPKFVSGDSEQIVLEVHKYPPNRRSRKKRVDRDAKA